MKYQSNPTRQHIQCTKRLCPCVMGQPCRNVPVPDPPCEQTTTAQWVGLSMVPRFLHNTSQGVSSSHIGTYGCVALPTTLALQCAAAACACFSAGDNDMQKWPVPGWGAWAPYATGRSENSLFHRRRRLLSYCWGAMLPKSQATRHPNSCSQCARNEVAPDVVHPGHFGQAQQDGT